MSQTDSFIDEVTEEVRRDRLFALMRRYGWIGIVAVLLIVAGAAWSEWRKARDEAAARAFGDAVLAAMQSDDSAARLEALGRIEAGAGRGGVLGLIAAAEALETGDREAARARLEAVAADPALPAAWRDLARLKSILIAGDALPAAERDAALAELARPGGPYRPLAMEQQALALAGAGEAEAAVALLRQIRQEPGVTAGLLRRATQLIVALGADPDAA